MSSQSQSSNDRSDDIDEILNILEKPIMDDDAVENAQVQDEAAHELESDQLDQLIGTFPGEIAAQNKPLSKILNFEYKRLIDRVCHEEQNIDLESVISTECNSPDMSEP